MHQLWRYRGRVPNILSGVYPLGIPVQYLTVVLFYMVKSEWNDGF